MTKLHYQVSCLKSLKLLKFTNSCYNNPGRWFATAKTPNNNYFDQFVNKPAVADSCCEHSHRPDGWVSLHEFKSRRQDLASAIIQFYKKCTNTSQKSNHTQHHLLIVPASEKQFMVGKVPYFYRQSSDFRYLTGHLLPDAALVLEIEHDEQNPNSFQSHSTLFVQDLNPREELWEGKRIPPEIAKDYYGVDDACCISSLRKYIDSYLKDKEGTKFSSKNVAIWYDYNNSPDKNIHEIMKNLKNHISANLNEWNILSPKYCIDEARLIKSPAEIELMRKSCQIASSSIQDTIRQSYSLNSELQMSSTVEHNCKMQGASHMAYPSVVASGDNCNIIHYSQISNDEFSQYSRKHDLLLMDAGCEFGGYTSDVTRTWPLDGCFNNLPQRLVYEAVLDVQQTLIKALQQNNLSDCDNKIWTVDGLYYEMKNLFLPHFVELGLIDEKDKKELANAAISEACPHHVSHYLGMDVHDTPSISKSTPLLPGMVITIEPALYFPRYRNLRHVKLREELKGIGVRVEDDILITETDVPYKDEKSAKRLSCEILSSRCPRSTEDLEDIMSQNSR